MARSVTVCIDTNVLLGFLNGEPDKVESCAAFFSSFLHVESSLLSQPSPSWNWPLFSLPPINMPRLSK